MHLAVTKPLNHPAPARINQALMNQAILTLSCIMPMHIENKKTKAMTKTYAPVPIMKDMIIGYLGTRITSPYNLFQVTSLALT